MKSDNKQKVPAKKILAMSIEKPKTLTKKIVVGGESQKNSNR